MNWGIIALFGSFILVALALACRYGKKVEQLKTAQEKMRKRAEEQYNAQKLLSAYANMSRDDVNRRLCKKRKTAFKRLRSKNRLDR